MPPRFSLTLQIPRLPSFITHRWLHRRHLTTCPFTRSYSNASMISLPVLRCFHARQRQWRRVCLHKILYPRMKMSTHDPRSLAAPAVSFFCLGAAGMVFGAACHPVAGSGILLDPGFQRNRHCLKTGNRDSFDARKRTKRVFL